MAPTSKYVAVVAIDFGTTYSGFSFSFYGNRGEGGIHMNREWGNEEGRSTLKTPTSILLSPKLEFDSFGYEADDKYVHLKNGVDKEYYYLKHFKMELHKSKTLDRNTKLVAANGKQIDAMIVFSLSIKYMKDEAIKTIRQRTGNASYDAKDIQWVLTVPAIWCPGAKQFMREAACTAGITSENTKEQLIIALEPEGGAIFCQKRSLRDFSDQKGDASISDVFTRPGHSYAMVDIGGGTLDVTVHEVLTDGSIKEVHQVSGGPFGGIYVDQKFEHLLGNLFERATIRKFRTDYPADWLRMMNEFEMKKRGRRAFDGKPTRITLPRSFLNQVYKPGKSDVAGRLAMSCNIRDVEIYNDEFICLGPTAMKSLFYPVVSGIVGHLEGLLRKPELQNLTCLFMVGGFAESVILQEAMKTAFNMRFPILIPNYAGIAVVQGATMFGQKPEVISSRIMATTYGFGGIRSFNPKTDDPKKKFIVLGEEKCNDIFEIIVKENESVKVGEKRCFTRHPLYPDQKNAMIRFYTSTDVNVKYTTDHSVGPSIGNLSVESPNTSLGKNRDIELSVFFGGTEIKATAVDKASMNTAVVYLDFLCKS
ncbi:heat shock 70 kDa protein 12A [Pocillopora verrucosa]|uniref:heat shock 70 kDa protein 12A n=1 Tax=Pocillopora verrucosa TaxID=203993 RepID=UPI0033426B4E